MGLHAASLGGADSATRIDDSNARLRDGLSVPGISTRLADRSSNAENTSEDLAALDRLITYLLGQHNGNLENWRRSRRASARGYRQLRPNAPGVDVSGIAVSGVGTTPL